MITGRMGFDEFQARFSISLNRQQLEAVKSVEGPVLLLAVPGSGKTTVLITRLGYMIFCCGIAPENILTVTYTVAATKEMAARYIRLFGEESGGRLEFRTINGICARIILYYGRSIGKNAFELISDEKKIQSVLSAIYQKITGEFAVENDLKAIRTRITYIKNMLLSEEEIKNMDGEAEYSISEIYKEYTREMRNRGWMDYDDQMLYAYNILRRCPEVLHAFQQKYQYICVDEAQDTSKIQHSIIQLLAGERDNLFLVGDEDQSIYGFRAAYPEALLSFEQQHKNPRVLLMEENFRSSENIVRAADQFIQKNELRHKKYMKAARSSGAEIRGITLKSRKAQYQYLTKVASVCRTQTAVLYRDNESVIPLVDLLERNDIPYQIRNAELSFFTNRIVTDIRNIILFALNPKDTGLFMQIYYKISTRFNKQTAINVCKLSESKDMSVLDTAISYGHLTPSVNRNCRILRNYLNNLPIERAEEGIGKIIKFMGYGEYLERMQIDSSKLYILRILAAREDTVSSFLDRLGKLQEIIRSKKNNTDCPFLLSTIHASKGLEYNTVYLMDVADGIFPESVPENRKDAAVGEWEAYEEERRLFYVGVTRAKNYLNIFQFNRESTFGSEFMGMLSVDS